MTEYIVEESPTTYETDILGVKHSVTSYRRREEIVRCRDCKHYHKHKWFDIIPGTPLGSDMSDVCMFFGGGVKVEPGGFCKWGERREQ